MTWRPGIGTPYGRCLTVDVSPHGMLLRSPHRMPIGHHLDLDIEAYMPMRVHLGFEWDALVVDGPAVTQEARLTGVVRRCERGPSGLWNVGVEFDEDCDPAELRVIDLFIDHLNETTF